MPNGLGIAKAAIVGAVRLQTLVCGRISCHINYIYIILLD